MYKRRELEFEILVRIFIAGTVPQALMSYLATVRFRVRVLFGTLGEPQERVNTRRRTETGIKSKLLGRGQEELVIFLLEYRRKKGKTLQSRSMPCRRTRAAAQHYSSLHRQPHHNLSSSFTFQWRAWLFGVPSMEFVEAVHIANRVDHNRSFGEVFKSRASSAWCCPLPQREGAVVFGPERIAWSRFQCGTWYMHGLWRFQQVYVGLTLESS